VVVFSGYSDDAGEPGVACTGIIGVADPTDTTPAIRFRSGKQNGTGWQALGSDETVAQFQNYTTSLMTILGDGNVGIGTATIPHGGVGYAKLAIEGTNSSSAGPHVQFTTASDDYPLLQIIPWTHDDVSLMFDSYYDGGYKSSDAGSNYRLLKNADKFQIQYDSGIAAGSVVTWNAGMVLDNSGNVGIANTAPCAPLHIKADPANTSQPQGANNAPLADSHTALFINGTGSALNEKIGLQFGSWSNHSIGGIFGVTKDSANSTSGHITFDMRKATTDTSLTEVMTITNSGNVGIGETAPSAPLEITDTGSGIKGLLKLNNNRGGSQADADGVGILVEGAIQDNANSTTYGRIICQFDDVTQGTIDSSWRFKNYVANNETEVLSIVGGNATFTGTIGSGAITSTGKVTATSLEVTTNDMSLDSDTHANFQIDRGSTGYHSGLLFYTAGALKWRITQQGADNILKILGNSDADVVTFTDTNATFAGDITADEITLNSDSHAYVNLNSSAANTASWFKVLRGGTGQWLLGCEGGDESFQMYNLVSNNGTKFRLTQTGNATFAGTVHLDGVINFPSVTAGSWVGRNHAYDTMELMGYGAEFMIGSQHSSIYINYRTCNSNISGMTPTLWLWNAGSSTSWATHKASAWNTGSDIKLKKDIEPIPYGLDAINLLQPKKYKLKQDDSENLGLIAQDVEGIIDEIVSSDDKSDTKFLNYTQLIPVLIKAVQELSAKVEALENA